MLAIGPAFWDFVPKLRRFLPLRFRDQKGLENESFKPLKELVEPDGIEPTTSTMACQVARF